MPDRLLPILQVVRAEIERGWCQGAPARQNGKPVRGDDPRATSRCLTSACSMAVPPDHPLLNDLEDSVRIELARSLAELFPVAFPEPPASASGCGALLVRWNDDRGRRRAHVLALIDHTIARLERAGKEPDEG